jgi:ABC-type uncharacterized transport system permease subunit
MTKIISNVARRDVMNTKNSDIEKADNNVNYDRLDQLVRKFEKIFNILVPFIAIIISLLVVGLIIALQGGSPLLAYASLFNSAFGSAYGIATSLNIAVPLILVGLGIALAARAGIINLGGEGQIIIGGVFGTIVATQLQGLPPILHISLSILAGFIGGALWAFVPGYFYAKHGTNIIITTMLLNDIAIGVLGALVKGPMKEPPGYYPQSAVVFATAKLPVILANTRLHAGLIIALVLAIISYVLIFKTPFGHDIRTIGENPTVAKHSGMKVFKIQIISMLLAGGLAGMGGAIEILGSQHRLRSGFLTNYGYEALAVALLGQKNPLGVVLAGILFGALKAGRGGMVRAANLPASLSLVLSGVIIFFVAISPVLMKLPRYLAIKELNSNKYKQENKLNHVA